MRPHRLLAMAAWLPRVTAFALSIDRRLAAASLPGFLAAITPEGPPRGPRLSDEEMVRVIWNVLRWNRGPLNNGCFVRSFTRYRFLREMGRPVVFHLGVEWKAGDAIPGADDWTRLRSHAWLTLDGRPFREFEPERLAGYRTLLRWPALEQSRAAGDESRAAGETS